MAYYLGNKPLNLCIILTALARGNSLGKSHFCGTSLTYASDLRLVGTLHSALGSSAYYLSFVGTSTSSLLNKPYYDL